MRFLICFRVVKQVYVGKIFTGLPDIVYYNESPLFLISYSTQIRTPTKWCVTGAVNIVTALYNIRGPF